MNLKYSTKSFDFSKTEQAEKSEKEDVRTEYTTLGIESVTSTLSAVKEYIILRPKAPVIATQFQTASSSNMAALSDDEEFTWAAPP